nr:endo-1,3;1,4-beta-D-glucanase-like [Ipomoea batatas]
MSGPQCFNNPPTLSSTTGSGSLQEIAGIKTYVSGSQDSKLAILMISDVLGYEAPKLRKLADKVAGAGFLVVVPDLFYGDPFNHQKYATGVQSFLAAHPPCTGGALTTFQQLLGKTDDSVTNKLPEKRQLNRLPSPLLEMAIS